MKLRFSQLMSLIILMAVLIPYQLFSTDYEIDRVKKNLPKMLGANNVGKEFWLTIPPCYEDESGGFDNFVKIFVTSPVRTIVSVDIPGKGFHAQKSTVANDVIEFNVTPSLSQCYTRTRYAPLVAEKVYPGFGIHITAEQSIVVYVVIRYMYTSDGFLAIPVSSLGREYIVASYGDMGAMYNSNFPSESGIVGAYDKTKVTFTLGGNAMTKTPGGMKPGQIKSETLNEGDVWMFSSANYEGDLTGSKVVATKPVAVVSGNFCTNIPTTNTWCDYTVEMDLPMYTWGLNYHVGKVPNRKHAPIIRVFAKEPNTALFRDGKGIGNIMASGGVLGVGYLEMRLVPFDAIPRSAVISGDKPIGVTLYNTGVAEDGYPLPNSDPFVMAQTPMEQYQKEITFCTPAVYGGENFPENYINLVYETNEHFFMGDDMKFAEVSSGQFQWSTLKSKFSGADELFKYVIDGRTFALKTITLPKDGVYKIKADRPFAAYSYGYSWCDSYGYPTSAALIDVSRPDTVAPVPKWIMECDGTISGATITDMPEEDSIRVNLSLIEFLANESYNYAFDYKDFEAGMDRSTTWELVVLDKTEDAKALILFADRNGNDTIVTIIYKATKIAIRPIDVNYGLLEPGKPKTVDFWAINESLESSVRIDTIRLKTKDPSFNLPDQGFELLGLKLPMVIQKNDSVKFQCRFNATVAGTFIDSIGIGDTCIFSYDAQVKASVGVAKINVTDIPFGTVSVGKEVYKDFLITNPSVDKVDLEIVGFDGNFVSVFTPTGLTNLNISKTNPLIVKTGAPVPITVRFKPNVVGDFRDSIIFHTNNASGDDSICVLTGNSIEPGFIPNSYNWGKRRIHRPGTFPMGPYDAKSDANQPRAIKFVNDGSEEVKITDVVFSPGNHDAFLVNGKTINQADFTSKIIPPTDSFFVDVTFQPTTVGEHKMTITYETTAGSGKISTLEGIGLVPVITIEPSIDFGTTLVNDVNPTAKTITLTNTNYQWEDTVSITNLVESPSKSISFTAGNLLGSLGFSFDKADYVPKKLAPGESFTIDAAFVAQKEGKVQASLETRSDALAEVKTTWDGNGIVENAITTVDNSKICVGEVDTLRVSIKNTGSAKLINISPVFETTVSDLLFVNPGSDTKFDLEVGETHEILITFTPTTKKKFDVKIIYNNETQSGQVWESVLSCESVFFSRTTSIAPLEQIKHIGQDAVLHLNLDGAAIADYDMVNLQEIYVTVNYENNFLYIDNDNQITPGSLIKDNFDVVAQDGMPKFDQQNGKVYLKLVAKTNGAKINAGGELANITFRCYLPSDYMPTGAKVQTAKVSMQVEPRFENVSCTRIDTSLAMVSLEPICVDNITHIAMIQGNYYLKEIAPNPVGPTGANIEFGVALKGWTMLGIYNEVGELVSTLVGDVMAPGSYSLPIPVQDLSNGVYYVRFLSGQVSKTSRLVIVK